MKVTDEDRKNAQAKKETKAMAPAALAKLHAQKAEQKIEDCALLRFSNALASVVVTRENLRKLISRIQCAGPLSQLERRAEKLAWWIRAGFKLGREIDTPAIVLLFSTITPDEAKMTDAEFSACWSETKAKKRLADRIAHGLVEADAEEQKPKAPKPHKKRFCASGEFCRGRFRGKGAEVTGRTAYCCRGCGDSAKARKKRLCVTGIDEKIPLIETKVSEARISTAQ